MPTKTDFQPGFRLLGGTDVNLALTNILSNEGLSAQVGITATAGGGQTNAYQLSKSLNRVTTVATAADSVKLPSTRGGGKILAITNSGANSLQVFGRATATINGVAAGTGVAQAAGITALYICPAPGIWFRLLSA